MDSETQDRIAGYRRLGTKEIVEINRLKIQEATILAWLDELIEQNDVPIDRRWMAIARAHIEQGFMAANRSIARPDRIGATGPET